MVKRCTDVTSAMATKKQYVNGIASKANILMAVRMCFAQRGFFEISMTDIDKAAKTTRGVLYYHFASKDEMILAITSENLCAAAQKIEADLQQLQATGKGELKLYPRVIPLPAGRLGVLTARVWERFCRSRNASARPMGLSS